MYLFIKFGHFTTFAIIYAKTVMCIIMNIYEYYWISLKILSYVSQNFYGIQIAVRMIEQLFIYKCRTLWHY